MYLDSFDIFVFWLYTFGAQDLLLALCLGITPRHILGERGQTCFGSTHCSRVSAPKLLQHLNWKCLNYFVEYTNRFCQGYYFNIQYLLRLPLYHSFYPSRINQSSKRPFVFLLLFYFWAKLSDIQELFLAMQLRNYSWQEYLGILGIEFSIAKYKTTALPVVL